MSEPKPDLVTQHHRLLREAVARITWSDELGRGGSGTGYLLSRDLVATCDHVLGPPNGPLRWQLSVTLADGVREATVLGRDARTDCALLRLARETALSPLRLGASPSSKEPFRCVGFPATLEGSPVLITGSVQDLDWPDASSVPSILLFSPSIAAGRGALAQGFSGSPVVIGDVCIGHLKSIIPDPGEAAAGRPYAQLGYLYACQSSAVVELSAGLVQAVLPAQRPQPTRLSLRKLLMAITKGDLAFDSFFKNYYTDLYKNQISMGMGFPQKIDNFLTLLEDDYADVLDNLKIEYPSEFERHKGLLVFE